jgi:hypothetical protein
VLSFRLDLHRRLFAWLALTCLLPDAPRDASDLRLASLGIWLVFAASLVARQQTLLLLIRANRVNSGLIFAISLAVSLSFEVDFRLIRLELVPAFP